MPIVKEKKIQCSNCKVDFVLTSSFLIQKLYTTDAAVEKNFYNICKKCLIEKIESWYDYKNIEEMFEKLNIPLIEKLWHESISLIDIQMKQCNNDITKAFPVNDYKLEDKEPLSNENLSVIFVLNEYIKKTKMKTNDQYFFNKGYQDSLLFTKDQRKQVEEMMKQLNKRDSMMEQLKQSDNKNTILLEEDLKLDMLDDFGNFKTELLSNTDYIYLSRKWGLTYDNYELIKLEEYWIKAYNSFEIATSTHQDYLLKIAKISLQMDKTLEQGKIKEFNDLAGTYDKLMKSAAFTAKDKAAASEKNYINTISQLSLYCEENGGFIPKFDTKYPKDLIDATIENLKGYTKTLVSNETNLDSMAAELVVKMQQDRDREEDEEEEPIDDDDEIVYEDDYYVDNFDPESYIKQYHGIGREE